jgi:hypothetical protein
MAQRSFCHSSCADEHFAQRFSYDGSGAADYQNTSISRGLNARFNTDALPKQPIQQVQGHDELDRLADKKNTRVLPDLNLMLLTDTISCRWSDQPRPESDEARDKELLIRGRRQTDVLPIY